MPLIRFFIVVTAIILLAGCARLTGTPLIATTPVTPDTTPAETTATALSDTDVHDFLDPDVVGQMSDKERAEAASAQFYALQFGRPGAPRPWTGDVSASGKVTVGPYVRVNSRDCREFIHEVTVEDTVYTRSGTACREDAEGGWTVVSVNAIVT